MSCSSHYVTDLAPFFIDPQANWSTAWKCIWYDGVFSSEGKIEPIHVYSSPGEGTHTNSAGPARTLWQPVAGCRSRAEQPKLRPWDQKRSTRGVRGLQPGTDKSQALGEQGWLPSQAPGFHTAAPGFDETPALPEGLQSIRSAPEARNQTFNDPSAGSPTETLLRLLLPLSATVWTSFRQLGSANRPASNPRSSLKHSIGSSDGRCVQRAGT